MVNRDLGEMRKSYTLRKLERSELESNPIDQFKLWFDDAIHSQVYEPNAMALASVSLDLKPSCRIVLLKAVDHGFIFYSNYASHKGEQMDKNQQVAATFWWDRLERQVRIEGQVEKIDGQMSDQYFLSRPPGSQLSAACSPQSQIISSYQDLLALRENLADKELNRPEHWGGYRLIAQRMEFWQGRENRLHDRFVYQLEKHSQNWQINRLAP